MGNPFKGRATSGGGNYSTEVPEAGTHPAILVGLVDIGTHEEEFQGQKKTARKVIVLWELTGMVDSSTGQNHLVNRKYSLSFHKKASLRLMAEAIRGKAYDEDASIDFDKMLGAPCLVSLEHKTSSSDRTYAVVKQVSKLMKGLTVPQPKRKPAMWALNDDGSADFDSLPQWLPWRDYVIEDIKASHEYQAYLDGGDSEDDADEEKPQRAASSAGAGGEDEKEIRF